jgi:hypothetical protein
MLYWPPCLVPYSSSFGFLFYHTLFKYGKRNYISKQPCIVSGKIPVATVQSHHTRAQNMSYFHLQQASLLSLASFSMSKSAPPAAYRTNCSRRHPGSCIGARMNAARQIIQSPESSFYHIMDKVTQITETSTNFQPVHHPKKNESMVK